MKQAANKNEGKSQNPAFQPYITDEQAKVYIETRFDSSRRIRRLNRIEVDFARQVMDLVGPSASVLDAPCGTGRFLDIFKNARRLTMLDFSPAMLGVVREKAAQYEGIDIRQGDVSALPFEDAQFDLVFSMRMLHHIGEESMRRKILGELTRVSRGYVALSVYSKNCLRYLKRRIRGKQPRGCSVSLGKFIKEADEAGLTLICKVPRVSLIEQQRMLVFKKRQPGSPG